MIEEKTFKGYWRQPGNDHDVAGVLEFKPKDKIELQLLGTLGDQLNDIFDDKHKLGIIHGDTVDGKKVTLINCPRGQCSMSSPGYATINYQPSRMLIGAHTDDLAKFNKVEAEMDLLTKWLDIWGYKHKPLEGTGFSFDYNYPEDIEFCLGDVTGRFTFYAFTQFNREETFESSHKAKIVFMTKEGLTLENIMAYVWNFKKFLVLATKCNTYIKSIQLESDMLKGEDLMPKPLILLYSQNNLTSQDSDKHSMNFLFTYKKIEGSFERVIKNWYAKKDALEPIINSIYISYTEPLLYIQNMFMDVIQALEVFHRRFIQDTNVLKSEHLKWIDSISIHLDETEREFLKDKLAYGYEPGLFRRLKELFDLYGKSLEQYIGGKSKVKSLISKSVASRNYYTHYGEGIKKEALKGNELYYASERLKILLLNAILVEIGIDKAIVETIIEHHIHLRYDLFN